MPPPPSSRLVDLIDWYKSAHPDVTDAEIARRAGVTRANLSQWRSNGVRGWPARATLDALAVTIGRPYRELLDAVLADTGYADTSGGSATARPYQMVLDDAVRVLTEAARLTNQPVRQKPDGSWEPDLDADGLPIDWAAFVTTALAGAAANIGGIDAILAGRPGSWEAAVVRDALNAAVGHDEWDLWRHRTEPVNVVVHPERILLDMGSSSAWDHGFYASETELQRRENAIRPSYTYSYPGHELSDDMRAYYADLGVEIIDGPPPPLPTVEAIEAAMAAERENPTELTPEEQATEDALAAIEALRERLEALQREELAEYGRQVAQAVRERLTALKLPVPVTVTVDIDTPWDQAPETPLEAWATGAIERAIAAAIAETPTPDTLPGTPLQRAEAALAGENGSTDD
jgi:transcriptional regulator with XRE-family HTH domain